MLEVHGSDMSLTFESLSDRLAALEYQVGIGTHWSRSEITDRNGKSLAHELAELQAKVNHIFRGNPEIRSLPDIIKQYRNDPEKRDNIASKDYEGTPQPSVLRPSTLGAGAIVTKKVESAESGEHQELSDAEKQELVLVHYPAIIECHNRLMEFSTMNLPSLSIDLSDQLSLRSLQENKASCESIARQYHLLVVKSLVVLEKFTSLVELHTDFSRNVEKRMQILANKILSLERVHMSENKY